ncbi:MAG TPA: class I SAM-dependent methyltransferase [Spirochaetia bacterium]|nr:class I SAM-dependent methyltransferase [Spirochaetia bacterium]
MTDLHAEINKDFFRQNLRRYTWQAYQQLPAVPHPSILDLGCGSGVPTLELALLSKGIVTAVDTDKAALSVLRTKARALGLAARIKILQRDFTRLRGLREHFDIVWSEGAAAVIGFARALTDWRRFLKPGGFLVLHDDFQDHTHKLDAIPKAAYRLLDHFRIGPDIWFRDYFKPLKEHLDTLQEKYANRPDYLAALEKEEAEFRAFQEDPNRCASVFYLMQRNA